MKLWHVAYTAGLPVLAACAERPPVQTLPAALANAPAPAARKPRVANAERTVADLRHEFKRCYDDALRESPTLSGRVTLSLRIAPAGTVTSSEVLELEGLSSPVVSCVVAVADAARFEAPGGEGSTLIVPLKFRPAER